VSDLCCLSRDCADCKRNLACRRRLSLRSAALKSVRYIHGSVSKGFWNRIETGLLSLNFVLFQRYREWWPRLDLPVLRDWHCPPRIQMPGLAQGRRTRRACGFALPYTGACEVARLYRGGAIGFVLVSTATATQAALALGDGQPLKRALRLTLPGQAPVLPVCAIARRDAGLLGKSGRGDTRIRASWVASRDGSRDCRPHQARYQGDSRMASATLVASLAIGPRLILPVWLRQRDPSCPDL
jgi:hypothetical protein